MPDSDLARPRPLRIAAVPAAHPYVKNLVDPAEGGVTLLADPPSDDRPAGQWWPPAMIDPLWIARNSGSFDLLHLHFGIESFSLTHLQQVVDALRAANRPLVFTVHDLTNPQLTDQEAHLEQLALLVGAADEVITLTEGAAREVRERWGRDAAVIAHPRLREVAGTVDVAGLGEVAGSVDVAGLSGARTSAPDDRGGRVAITIGVHLRDLRPNIDALLAIDTLLAAVAQLRSEESEGPTGLVRSTGRDAATALDLRVVVELNDRVRDEPTRAALRSRLSGVPFAELREHPRFTDSELAAALLATDISVMPYGHGTHSGWLELCWDLAVGVAAPDVGFYAEQHPVPGEVATYRRGSVASLVDALRELLAPIRAAEAAAARAAAVEPVARAADPTFPTPREARRAALRSDRASWRRSQQRDIHLAHLAVYRLALAGARV